LWIQNTKYAKKGSHISEYASGKWCAILEIAAIGTIDGRHSSIGGGFFVFMEEKQP